MDDLAAARGGAGPAPGPEAVTDDDHGAGPGANPAAHPAAYLDLDKTLLATSTTFALSSPMRRRGLISTPELARGVIAQLPYLVRGADEEQSARLMEQLASLSAGVRRAELQEVVRAALATAIEPAVYAEALDLITAHHRAGHDVVIVSASSTDMVEPVAELVGADRCVATRMEVDAEGRFTGRIERSLLHGAKVVALEEDAAAFHTDLARSWAYSDSVSDLPMLEAVGHPVAVNPDRALRQIAAERGWPVRDFERPVTLGPRVPRPALPAWARGAGRPSAPLAPGRLGTPGTLRTRGTVALGALGLVLAAAGAGFLVARGRR